MVDFRPKSRHERKPYDDIELGASPNRKMYMGAEKITMDPAWNRKKHDRHEDLQRRGRKLRLDRPGGAEHCVGESDALCSSVAKKAV